MKFLAIAIGLLFSFQVSSAELDSIGFEKKNGKILVLHQVDPNETLYGLSKKYGVQMDEILKINPEVKSGLHEGDILRIPYRKKKREKAGLAQHTVHAGETLFFISRLYDVTVDEIKEWNGLTSNNIEPGQILLIKESNAPKKEYTVTTPPPGYGQDSEKYNYHVVVQGETLYSISRQYEVEPAQLQEWNELSESNIHIGQQLIVGLKDSAEAGATATTAVTSSAVETKPKKPTEEIVYLNADHSRRYRDIVIDNTGFSTKTESGLAEVISGTDDSRKFLALHRTLPVGTILMVKNEMNNEIVFVRVLGKLPDTGSNQNIIIKISNAAYDRLKGVGQRFRVQLSYIPLEEENGS